ncbi:MAG: cysteine hydrolase [Nanoarchaeota archaeon]|nr:cysteine hydrolase [Nanoarchaeota archaeon]
MRLRVFWDVDTQYDFMKKEGALYVPDAELIRPNLKLLTDFAREKGIPIVGSVDRHFGNLEYKEREGELRRWGGPFPDHCMNHTAGQDKIWETTLKRGSWGGKGEGDYNDCFFVYNPLTCKVTLEEVRRETREFIEKTQNPKFWEASEEEIKDMFILQTTGIDNQEIGMMVEEVKRVKIPGYLQRGVYFEKQTYNVFDNPNTGEFIKRAGIDEAVVYGVATDFCVRAGTLELQNRGVQCYVIEDAVKGVFPDTTQKALEEMVAAGAKLITTKDVLEGRI